MIHEIEISTNKKEEIIDITNLIKEVLKKEEIYDGICYVMVPHTTAGITINENADPSVKDDILKALKHFVPDNLGFKHGEGNSPAHVKSILCGFSVTILVEEKYLRLGTWQGVMFVEMDGPRRRKVQVKFIKG